MTVTVASRSPAVFVISAWAANSRPLTSICPDHVLRPSGIPRVASSSPVSVSVSDVVSDVVSVSPLVEPSLVSSPVSLALEPVQPASARTEIIKM